MEDAPVDEGDPMEGIILNARKRSFEDFEADCGPEDKPSSQDKKGSRRKLEPRGRRGSSPELRMAARRWLERQDCEMV